MQWLQFKVRFAGIVLNIPQPARE